MVKGAVGRPLRAVGRKLGLPGRPSRSDAEDDVVESAEYGTLIAAADEGDDEGSQKARPRVSRTRSLTSRRNKGSRRAPSRSVSSGLSDRSALPDPDRPVHYLECVMRQILLMCAAYILGSKRPEFVTQVGRVTEYAVTAWGTCVVILVLVYIQKHYPHLVPPSFGRLEDADFPAILTEERLPLMPARRSTSTSKRSTSTSTSTSTSGSKRSSIPVPPPELELEHVVLDRVTSVDDSIDVGPAPSNLAHPALECFYINDVNTGERIYPNAENPTHISTEWFEMDMVVIIRTPDVDDPSAPGGSPSNKKMADYLRSKQRRFEYQYQIKLKKVPTGQSIYFACELEEPIKMGIVQRAFVGAAMAFMKSTNPTFHYSITGSKEKTSDGKYEMPHMSFTVEGSLDRLVVTKPEETPPELGMAIYEDPESIKRRKKGVPIDWNTQDTYTMALWSAYVDFLDWRVINLPGIRPFGLASILGKQAMNLTMYLIEEDRGNDKHYRKDITNVINLELSNDKHAEKGPAAQGWAKENERSLKKRRKRANSIEVEAEKRNSGDSNDHSLDLQQLSKSGDLSKSGEDFITDEFEEDDDAETAAELGEGIYMRSGDSVCLREFLADEENTRCVSNGGGFAVLQEKDVCVVIEKTRRSKRNRLIKSGDSVMFKMIQKKGEEMETRYLTIHRGWWLKWVSSVPSKNGFFTIYTNETEFADKDEKDTGRSDETQSSYLTMGGSFTLRHKRWSRYHVGVAADPSPTYGGRMLGLHNPKSEKGDQADEQYHSDEGDAPEEGDPIVDNKAKPAWMKPLVLCAVEPTSLFPTHPLSPKSNSNAPITEFEDGPLDSAFITPNKLVFSSENSHVDVPAWIEMMNRTERVRQLTYVVRVVHPLPAREEGKGDDSKHEESEAIEKGPETFVRLRSGRELARIMRVGQSVNLNFTPTTSTRQADRRNTSSEKLGMRHSSAEGTSTPPNKRKEGILSLSPNIARSHSAEVPLDFSFDASARDDESEEESIDSVEEAVEETVEEEASARYESDDQMVVEIREEQDDGFGLESESEEMETESEAEVEEEEHRRKKRGVVGKGKAMVGKVAKTAKNATFATGMTAVKTVVGTGKLSAKAVVGTGKLAAKTTVGTGKLAAKTVVGTGKLTGKAVAGTTKVAVGTGKAAMRQSKKIAKGTVNVGKKVSAKTVHVGKKVSVKTGKAVIAPISRKSKKPPKAEPKTKHKEKDRLVEVSKTM
jgi:hypothetical protein